MTKYIGVARDTLLLDTPIEIERGQAYTLPDHPEVSRALAAGTLMADLSGAKPTPSLESLESQEARAKKPKEKEVSHG
jgi:hypothetical protein